MYSKKLIRSLKGGSGESFSRFISENYSLYFSFAFALLKDKDIAKDIVQNVFLKLYLHREDIDEEKNLHNYILKSIRLDVWNYLRLSYNSRKSEMIPDGKMVQDAYSPVFYDDTLSSIKEIIAKMPNRRKQVLLLSRFHGKTNEEIAVALGISERTVQKHLELAIKQIKTHLVS